MKRRTWGYSHLISPILSWSRPFLLHNPIFFLRVTNLFLPFDVLFYRFVEVGFTMESPLHALFRPRYFWLKSTILHLVTLNLFPNINYFVFLGFFPTLQSLVPRWFNRIVYLRIQLRLIRVLIFLDLLLEKFDFLLHFKFFFAFLMVFVQFLPPRRNLLSWPLGNQIISAARFLMLLNQYFCVLFLRVLVARI